MAKWLTLNRFSKPIPANWDITFQSGVSTALVHYRTFVLTGTPLITNASTQALFDQMVMRTVGIRSA